MIIRELTEKDIPVIAEIERQCFSHPWSEQSIKSSFENSSNRFFAAETDGIVIGYIGLSVVLDEGYILNVATLPEYRRQGAAKALINRVIDVYNDKLRFLTLEVRPSNMAAIGLYEGFGFESVGLRKNYYHNPTEDAVLLTKFFNKDKV